MLVITDDVYNDDNWHHVLTSIYRDVADGAKLYIDGVLRKTGNPTLVGNVNPTDDLHIGSYVGGGTNLAGSIDQPRLMTRAWSAKEVRDYAINPWQVYLDDDD